MAIISRGILGGFKGKVANVVGTSWKGRAVMKSLPLSVANPRSPRQVSQRTKFSNVTQFASNLLNAWIKPLWNPFSGNVSGYNRFVSINTPLATDLMLTTLLAVKPTIGSIDVLKAGDVTVSASIGDSDVYVEWDGAPYGNQLSTDRVYCAIIDSTTGELLGASAGQVFITGSQLVVSCNRQFDGGDTVRCYLALRRADASDVSETTQNTVVIS